MAHEVVAAWVGAGGAILAAGVSGLFAVRSARSARQHDKEMEALRADLARAERHETAEEAAQRVVETFRRPMLAAAVEFKRRLGNILHGGFFAYLGDDQHRKQMALLSTAYRVAAYLGWRELLTRRLTYLHYEDSAETKMVLALLEDVSTKLARDDPKLGSDQRLMLWKDEQRAVGGLMLTDDGNGVVGFETFFAEFDTKFAPWLKHFVDGLEGRDVDLPGGRLETIEESLAALIADLDKDGVYRGRV
jgi:hypothetical protein